MSAPENTVAAEAAVRVVCEAQTPKDKECSVKPGFLQRDAQTHSPKAGSMGS